MMHRFHKPLRNTNNAKPGLVLGFLVVAGAVMLAFLGFSLYGGLSVLVQSELQKATSTASLVGASALFDGDTQLNPAYSPERAIIAAQNTFNRAIQNSPLLQKYGAQIQTGPTVTQTQITLRTQANIPMPLLQPIGIPNLQVTADGRAQYAQQVYANPFTLTPLQPAMTLALNQPLVDGPGPDVSISFGEPYQGVTIEACSGANDCYDITPAAHVGNTGQVVDRTVNGRNQRFLYGNATFDLSALTPGSAVRKASFIKLTDDGIPDSWQGGVRSVLTTPLPPVTVTQLEVFHHSVKCQMTCPMPPGFVTRTAPE
jgi:hypothetical protein